MMAAKTKSLTQSPTKGRAKARPRPSMYIGKKNVERITKKKTSSSAGLNVV